MRELAIRIKDISIHALREEGDADLPVDCHGSRDISIHALREEGDSLTVGDVLRGDDFYPRPPRGGRQAKAKR